ncbi:hypothetical protein CDL15_Pgr005543 [Punica granatum]|uniref:Albumin-2-like n=1 Tax=Punica granatum TaxID=22663 RepID=A0A218WVP0_PUNGR|nr:hypothetical protein CDL15_Pgr005543 [Punica granatum]
MPRSIRQNEVYLFMGKQYALEDYAPGTTDDRIINGPLLISNGFPSLQRQPDRSGLLVTRRDEAYILKGKSYALINFARGTHIINGPKDIVANWPSLAGIQPRKSMK